MHRPIGEKVSLGVVLLAIVLAAAAPVNAQSIVDAERVEFTPSTDHNVIDSETGARVQSYSLDIFVAGGASPVRTVSLGKPAPESDGMIRLSFLPLLSAPLTPGVVYEAQVSAVGPGGSASSPRSNTFAFSSPCSPAIFPGSANVAAASVTSSVTVTAAAGCAWMSTSNAPWITITAGASGSGNGSVAYAVAANPGTTSLYRHSDNRRQYLLDHPSRDNMCSDAFGAVSQHRGCRRDRFRQHHRGHRLRLDGRSNAAWITITAGASGSGNGSVTYTVAANPGQQAVPAL